MKRGPIIHGVLLVAALLFAYQTWTREEKVERKTGDIQIWSLPKDSITAVVFDSQDKTVRVEARKQGQEAYLWGTQTRSMRNQPKKISFDGGVATVEPESDKTTVTEFMVGDTGEELLANLSDFRALRELANPTDKDLEEYGLNESKDNITITHAGGSKSLVMGGKVYGSQDRYIRDPESGRVYVVAGTVLSNLITGEGGLRLREVHKFKGDEVDKAVVSAGGKTRNLVRIMVEGEEGMKIKNWADAKAPDKPDQTMSNFLQNIDNLQPMGYVPELDEKTLTLMVKVEYQRADGGQLGWLELYEKVEPAEETKPESPAPNQPEGADKDKQAADKQAADKQAADNQAADKQAADKQAADKQAADKQAADKQAAEQANKEGEKPAEAKPEEKPVKRDYYIRTERTRAFATVSQGAATRITEDIPQVFTE